MREPTVQVAFRLPKKLIGQLDRHAKHMTVEQPGLKFSRADAVRSLLTRALDAAGDAPRPPPPDETPEIERLATGLDAFDHVLGGGIVPGSFTLIGGPTGVGKTTLVLQAVTGLGVPVLYATGEQTAEGVASNAIRLRTKANATEVIAERNVEAVIAHAEKFRFRVVVVDSIQTATSKASQGKAGSISQVKACAESLRMFTKRPPHVAVIAIGHETAAGELSGPLKLFHVADTVLELEYGRGPECTERVLRCRHKNRFGTTINVGHFTMTTERGLVPDWTR